jgi:putative DNA methylase
MCSQILPTHKKKLIEVALPLEAINTACAREKSIRHGHPSTMHLWWARRPLAACRAVLFAQLVDDPSGYPEKFPTEEAVDDERKRLFAIIEDLVVWENSTNEEVLERARKEIRKSCDGELPPVYDPFSGGCSIPLEAQRLGLPAYGSDLNPVAVTIGKAMIEIPEAFKNRKPVHLDIKNRAFYNNCDGLAEDIKHYGEWLKHRAAEKIGKLYPKIQLPEELGGTNKEAIAWIWARTIPSPDPAYAEVQVPLVSNFVLNAKKDKESWIEPQINKTDKTITWAIRRSGIADEIKNAKLGTTAGKRQGFRCIFSNAPISYDYIRSKTKQGKMKSTLIAMVTSGEEGRVFVSPDTYHQNVVENIHQEFRPDLKLAKNPRDFKTVNYGMETFGDLFTDRQIMALKTFSGLLEELRKKIIKDANKSDLISDERSLNDGGRGSMAYAEAISLYLSFAITKMADRGSTVCTWDASRASIRNTFSRQAIAMTWDFAESNPFSGLTGSWDSCVEWIWKVVENFNPASFGRVTQDDAQTVNLIDNVVISTDPPYYDNINYSELSDYFFCWLKPILKPIFPNIFSTMSAPKEEELVANPYRHSGEQNAEIFFLDGMRKAITNMRDSSSSSIPTTIYYAFKQSEIKNEGISSKGWATFLQAVIESGYAIVGTWPLRTEMANRMVASGTNALANSVVLVCRNRDENNESITRLEFIRELKRTLPSSIMNLQAANVSPADMPQSAIGPGMAIFSKYSKILEADDSHMTVKTALQIINAELDEYLNNLHGDFDQNTRFTATWFEQNGYEKGDFGAANSLATARGISVESVKHAGIVESSAGKVRILKREELDSNWEPNSGTHLTVWECCQYLVREYGDGGETAAAMLIKKMGFEKADAVKDLAYYLYDICSNKRQDAKEATSYNALIAGWSDIMRMANSIHDTDTTRQASLF